LNSSGLSRFSPVQERTATRSGCRFTLGPWRRPCALPAQALTAPTARATGMLGLGTLIAASTWVRAMGRSTTSWLSSPILREPPGRHARSKVPDRNLYRRHQLLPQAQVVSPSRRSSSGQGYPLPRAGSGNFWDSMQATAAPVYVAPGQSVAPGVAVPGIAATSLAAAPVAVATPAIVSMPTATQFVRPTLSSAQLGVGQPVVAVVSGGRSPGSRSPAGSKSSGDSYWDSGGWTTGARLASPSGSGPPSLSRKLSSSAKWGKFSEPNSGAYWDAGQWDPDERIYTGAAAGQHNHLRAVDPSEIDAVGSGAKLSRAWAGGLVSENLGLGTSVGPPVDLAMAATEHRPTMKEQYEITDKAVGSGSFGVVRRAKHRPSEKPCVVKAVRKAQAGDQYRMNLVDGGLGETLLRMSRETPSANITQFFDILEGPTHFYVVMEELTGPELLNHVEDMFPVMEDFLQNVMKQIITALVHLHDVVHLYHRDIKLANLRFRGSPAESDLVLLDFGLSSSTLKAWDGAVCGTAMYMAPELVAQVTQVPFLPAMDLWAAGVILYVLLTGDCPFQDQEVRLFGQPQQAKEVERLREQKLVSEELRCASDESVDLLKQLLVIDHKARIAAAQALDHRWFSFAAGERRLSVSGAKYRAVRQASRQSEIRKPPLRKVSSDSFIRPSDDIELPVGEGLQRIVSVGDDYLDGSPQQEEHQ